MNIKELIRDIPNIVVKGKEEIEISGISANSKLVAPGNLFIAKKGLTVDGAKFIPDAVAAGAAAVLTDLYNPYLKVTQLIHPNVPLIEGKLAAKFFGSPSTQLKVVGITGTNGKTTCGYLIKEILDGSSMPAGLIGTVDWVIGERRFPGEMTSPEVITSQKLLKEMVVSGCKAAVMEVSSHALDQNRTDQLFFEVAVFTNLTQDHLNYHKTMEHYREAKEKLFTSLGSDKWAIINLDDPASPFFIRSTKAKVITYGIDRAADVSAKNLSLSDKEIHFTLCYQGKEVVCKSPLIGKFNVYNLLASFAAGIALGIPLEASVAILKTFKRVPGRLERIKNKLGIHIFVDYAHSEDALLNVLETLRGIKKGKLITVFGCGGERDQDKRPKMGNVVCRLSDEAIVTSDNPRSEDPAQIANEILKGFSSNYPVTVELDRKKAIEKAILNAAPHDMVLIAGKGHEKKQFFAHQIIPFDDVEVARHFCLEREELAACEN